MAGTVTTRQVRFDLDTIEAQTTHRTRDSRGCLNVSGRFSRTGVLSYKRADGSVVREFRSEAEVFDQASMDSLLGAPFTNKHGGMVTSKNMAELQVGRVTSVRRDGKYLKGDILVTHEDAIQEVLDGAIIELSCGYEIDDFDEIPGEHEGEHYDGTQRGIRYNHLAGGPDAWGRCGDEVRIRADGAASVAEPLVAATKRPSARHTTPITKEEPMSEKTPLRVGTLELDVEVHPSLVKPLQSALETMRTDAAQLPIVQGELATAKAENAELVTKLAKATDPAALQAAIAERSQLNQDSLRVAPKLKLDQSLTTTAQRVAALVASGKHTAADLATREDGFIAGAFAGALTSAPAAAAKTKDDKSTFGPNAELDNDDPAERTDAKGEDEVSPYQQMMDRKAARSSAPIEAVGSN